MTIRVLAWVMAGAMSPLVAQDRTDVTFILSGEVVLEGGDLLLEPVPVNMICSGAVNTRVYSKPGGQFSFSLTHNKNPNTDQVDTAGSPSGGGFRTFNQLGRGMGDSGAFGSGRSKFGRLNLSDCEISAELPGFSSSVIHLGFRDIFDNPNVGAVTLRSTSRSGGTTVSMKALAAPEKSVEAFSKALKELAENPPDRQKAIDQLVKAVEIYPDYAAAWYLMGQCQVALGDVQSAAGSFQEAVNVEPEYVLPYCGLAELHLGAGRAAEAADWARRALDLRPDLVRAEYFYAYANFASQNFPIAEEYARKVQESPEAAGYPGTHYLLGTVLAIQGDVAAAAGEYCRFLTLTPSFPNATQLRQQLTAWKQAGAIDSDCLAQ